MKMVRYVELSWAAERTADGLGVEGCEDGEAVGEGVGGRGEGAARQSDG